MFRGWQTRRPRFSMERTGCVFPKTCGRRALRIRARAVVGIMAAKKQESEIRPSGSGGAIAKFDDRGGGEASSRCLWSRGGRIGFGDGGAACSGRSGVRPFASANEGGIQRRRGFPTWTPSRRHSARACWIAWRIPTRPCSRYSMPSFRPRFGRRIAVPGDHRLRMAVDRALPVRVGPDQGGVDLHDFALRDARLQAGGYRALENRPESILAPAPADPGQA